MCDPVLARRDILIGREKNRVPCILYVEGGLHYLRGNAQPYFSLTCDLVRKGFPDQHQGGGADHVLILKYFSRFADLAALHLCSMDGAPMHSAGNGWYWLAGACGGLGESYHGSTGSWAKTPQECVGVLARHLRISAEEAQFIVQQAREGRYTKEDLARFVEAQRPRWKAEAEACISKHDLKIFGDAYNPKAE